MSRIILLIALVAVGCDAYFQQGFYTRSAVEQIDAGLRRLTAAATSEPSNPAQPTSEPRFATPQPTPAPAPAPQ